MSHALRGAALVVGAAFALLAVNGCSLFSDSSNGSNGPAQGVATTEADTVIVNAVTGSSVSASCVGTLISPHVVMTAAHCVANSSATAVHAPNAGNQSTSADSVMFYDYGYGVDAAHEHDVALLLLRDPISIPTYAAIDDSSPFRVPVTIDGRYANNGTAQTSASPSVTVQTTAPDGRPFALALTGAAPGAVAGGAVRRADGSVVGVYSGQGETTQAGYFARLDDAVLQGFIATVVRSVGESVHYAPAAGSSFAQGSISFFTGDALRNTGGAGSGSGSAPPAGNTTSPTTPKAPTASGTTGGTSNNDPSQPPGETVDSGKGDDDDNDGSQKDDGTSPYSVTPNSKLGFNDPDAKIDQGSNYWSAFKPDDPAAGMSADKNYAMNHPNVAEIGTHGGPGYLENAPTSDEIKMIADGKDGIVVGACYAGQQPGGYTGPDGPVPLGLSSAAKIARDTGIDPSTIYGCTSAVSVQSDGNSMTCENGSWVDGKGAAVSSQVQQSLGLKTVTKKVKPIVDCLIE